jgi:lysophospholipase L1-like esterase
MNHLSKTHLALSSAMFFFAACSADATNVLDPWVGTWGVAPQIYSSDASPAGKTLRHIAHTSIAGTALRITLSNAYGDGPLTITDVHAALPTSGSSINKATDRVLTFNGLPSVTLAPGESVTSDGVDFSVPALSDVAVTFFVPQAPVTLTGHSFSQQDRYEASGDVSGSPDIAATATGDYQFLTNIDVQNPTSRGSVVAIGASITDGFDSNYGTNHRWPNRLAERLQAAGLDVGVINEGISGNNLFSDGSGESALKRFDRDVLNQAGVRWVIFSDDPLNDLGNGDPQATAPNVITALKSLIERAHTRGVRFACSTLTPWEGAASWTPARETVRESINAWIKGTESTCDAIVDQDAATHDPARPTAFLPIYDSNDHLHPNDVGYAAIASAVNLSLFTPVALSSVSTPNGCGSFEPGNGLKPGQTLLSCDGRFTLNMQFDGNLVLYKGQDTVLWSSGTVNRDSAQLELTPAGDFILYSKLGEQLWRSGDAKQNSAEAFLQNDGNLVIYAADQPVWASDTAGN